MYSSRRYEKYISFVNRHLIKYICYCIASDCILIFLLCNIFFKSVIQICTNIAIEYVPHFCLSICTVMASGILVIGMNLHRQILFCIYKLYKYWKIVKGKTFCTYNFLSNYIYVLFQAISLIFTIGYYTLTVLISR